MGLYLVSALWAHVPTSGPHGHQSQADALGSERLVRGAYHKQARCGLSRRHPRDL